MHKTILITGGCGYIGSHLALLLQNKGFSIIVVDNLSTGYAENMLADVTYEIGDIGDNAFLEKIFNKHAIETVMHLAAKTSVEEAMHRAELYYEENLLKSINFMKICGRSNVKHFIFSSTAAVYGEHNNQAVKEDHAINPNNPYGKSKYLAELALSELARHYDIQLTLLRYFNVAGHHHSLKVGNYNRNPTTLIPVICRNIASGNFSIKINGSDFDTHDGTSVRDYIHVMDIANTHLFANKLYQANKQKKYTLNVGYGNGLSVLDIIKLVNSMLNNKLLSYHIADRRAGDVAYSIADNSQIKSLSWKSCFADSYKEIIISEIAWWKKILGT